MTRNEDVYRLAEVAACYAQQSDLLPPEKTIVDLMLPEWRNARMLDLGVGGGRTTLHFARCVREYVGADYSESMVSECEKRFATYPGRLSFVVCDARSMQMFADGSFDVILFSLNGIDSVDHLDRLTILKQVRRVGKPGGWFCFSSHNLNFGAQLFRWQHIVTLNPKLVRRTVKRLVDRFVYNWRARAAAVRRAPYMVINESAHSRRVLTYYIRPEEQLNQLRPNFTDVRVFSFASGREIAGHDEIQNAQDMCLYYLCRIGQ